MTLYQCNLLSETHQAEALWENRVHIGERAQLTYILVLYQMDSFYVEVFHHRELNAIKRFRGFSSTDQLEPYIVKIDVGRFGN